MLLTKNYFRAWMEHLSMRITATNNRLDQIMADVSNVLNEVASGLNDMGGDLSNLVAENVRLRTRNAELEGEDARESDAADKVMNAFNNLAEKLTNNSDAPNVDPVELPNNNPGDEQTSNENSNVEDNSSNRKS